MITKLHISNYRTFEEFDLECNADLNIVVGDNDSGKSTILEAIHLCLTRKLNGRFIESELSSALFNADVTRRYVASVHAGKPDELPSILIELCFAEQDTLARLKGTNNSTNLDCAGLRLEIAFDNAYAGEYELALQEPTNIQSIPTEYYRVSWYSFADAPVTSRSIPIRTSLIDATSIRLQSGADHYLSTIINSGLNAKERVGLAVAYRHLRELFSDQPALKEINTRLETKRGVVSDRELTIAMDVSSRTSWETSLVPHLDSIPYGLVGKGEQHALKILLALNREAEESHVLLIEEPENHMSFSSMSMLLSKIKDRCTGKQLFITTHSAYVLNTLGMDKVILLSDKKPTFLTSLSRDTREYFRKLSGYDTLRLILAKKTILVEGPSDELIVKKAFLDDHKCLPLDMGVDVLNVRGLSFPRFLDIAIAIGLPTVVVTDNDGDYQENVTAMYASYTASKNIKICADSNDLLVTLENQMLAANGLDKMNKIIGKTYASEIAILRHMKRNKTEWAMKAFDTTESITYPNYILDAVAI